MSAPESPIPTRSHGIRERELGREERADLSLFLRQARQLLSPMPSGARDLAARIDSSAERFRAGEGDPNVVAMALAVAWAAALRRSLGWHWGYLVHQGGGGIALLAPDHAHVLFPIDAVRRALSGTSPLLALTEQLLDSAVPPAPTNSYTQVR